MFVQDQVIAELVQNEYEVYVCKNHTKLAIALKKYTDAVLFINIDDGMDEPEWEKWIAATMATMPEVRIGLLTSNPNPEVEERFIKNIHIQCGFINLKLDINKAASRILDVLGKLNVKGRRKFLRASTEHEPNATLNMAHNNKYVKATIKDISVVGFSCVFDEDIDFRKNSLCKDLQIKLQTMLLKADCIVFGSRMEGEQKKYVFLFTQRISPDVRVKIRKYIHQNMQQKMDPEIN
jgi:hypothetical protein